MRMLQLHGDHCDILHDVVLGDDCCYLKHAAAFMSELIQVLRVFAVHPGEG